MPIRLLVLAMLVAALQIPLHAQDSNGTIQGVVRDSAGAPIPGAELRAVSDDVTVTTDSGSDGVYVFTTVPVGDYRVQVVDSGGRILGTTSVRIAPGGITQTVNFTIRKGTTGLSGAPAEPGRYYVGPVGFTPAVSLTNIGTDTNVFNEPDGETSDTAFTLTPMAGITVGTDQVRGEGTARLDYQYFNKNSGERSFNGVFGGGLEAPLGIFTPWVDGAIDAGRRRLDHVIDLRTRHLTTDARVGVDVRVTARTVASASVGRSDFGFDPNQLFRGSNLQEQLNRKSESFRFEVRQDLTPTIAVVARGSAQRDRFRFTPQRDADFGRYEAGINTAGRIATGSVRVGYLDLQRLRHGIANFNGVIASVDEMVSLGDRTRLQVLGTRDIAFSYDPNFPTYVRTGMIVDLLAALTDRLDAELRGSGERMRNEPVPGFGGAAYTDRYALVGAELGYRLVRDVRIGFGFAREQRDSPVHDHSFTGNRYGASVTVGAPPIVRNRYRE